MQTILNSFALLYPGTLSVNLFVKPMQACTKADFLYFSTCNAIKIHREKKWHNNDELYKFAHLSVKKANIDSACRANVNSKL